MTPRFHATVPMLDRDRYIEEMVDGVPRAFAYMARSHPDVEVYSIAIWTDERALMSAISIDTLGNSELKCREANRMRAEIRKTASPRQTSRAPRDASEYESRRLRVSKSRDRP